MAGGDALTQVLDWVAIHVPAAARADMIAALRAAVAEDGGPPAAADYWRTLAERLVAKGHLDIAREAVRRWQALAPPDHPIHAVLGGGPPPPTAEPAARPAPARKDAPSTRIVRVIDTTYTWKRIEAQLDKVGDRKVTACWEVFLDPEDKTSRAVLNEYDDGTFGPWAVSGVFTDFAGAAAVEVVIRSMQRHFVFTAKKADRTRRLLTNVGLPMMAVVGVLVGYVMGVL